MGLSIASQFPNLVALKLAAPFHSSISLGLSGPSRFELL